jgi:hypothetical protein
MATYFEKFLHHQRIIIVLWCLIIPIVFIKHNFSSSFPNNYKIFQYTYLHAQQGQTLYGVYPHQYDDKNHYGPFFSLFIAPFAILPDWAGHLLWVTMLVLVLLWAIRWLPLEEWQKNVIMLICLNELLTAAFNVQFNIAIAAFITLTFVLIHREKEFWAPLPILIGTFVKLYGVVGFAFFFLVKDKPKFILGCIVWSVVLFVTPMALSSPEYVVSMYGEWYKYLVIKNADNVSLTSYQDISIMGFFRRLLEDPTLPNLPFIAAGVALFGIPYLRFSQYKNQAYRLLLLASTLMFPVIFSSSSESSTYIIVFVGIAVWFAIQPRPYSWQVWGLLAAAILFGSFNTVDFYPQAFRTFLRLHSVKALPCAIIWLVVIYQMTRSDFKQFQVGKSSSLPLT